MWLYLHLDGVHTAWCCPAPTEQRQRHWAAVCYARKRFLMLLRFTVILWCVLPFQGWYSVAHITYRKVCVTFLLSRPATGKELLLGDFKK